jgi:hypothetical protein
VPGAFLEALDLVYGICDRKTKDTLWPPQATPKGLRHGFGVACIEKQIPLHLV